MLCTLDIQWSSHASLPIDNTVCSENSKLNYNNHIVEDRGLRRTFDYTLCLCSDMLTVHSDCYSVFVTLLELRK